MGEKCKHGVNVHGADSRCFACDPIIGAAIPMAKPQITPQDREAAEKFAVEYGMKFGHPAVHMKKVAANCADDGFEAGILHERARAEEVLVKALDVISKTNCNGTNSFDDAHKALKLWRGER